MVEGPGETRHATAVAALLDEQGGRMVGHARTRLASRGVPGSWADAEDVVQTACAQVLATSRPIRHVRAYLYRVIEREVDRAAKRYRAAHRDEARGGDGLFVVEPAARDPDVCDAVAERTDLSAALRALPPQQRTAVLCTKVIGLTQAETARAMGKNAGTVATHVSRAVTALKVSLGAVCIVLVGVTAAWLGAAGRAADPAAGGGAPPAAAGLLGAWGAALAGAALLLGVAWAVVRYPLRSPSPLGPKRFAASVLRRLVAVATRWWERDGPNTRGSAAGSERPTSGERLTARFRRETADRIAAQRRSDQVNGVTPMSTEDERRYARAVMAQILENHARAEIVAGRAPLDATAEERYAAAVLAALFDRVPQT
ncbi:hypothetical protein GCM10019016_098300 [Streptomyces prasinosporus]|uniref:Sigma-70 family RNA polymerase sigma factor n=1 Tax=Streptomyces prasinosporus TaxID=68256 RepID=A0ABP6U8Z0_9ACTN